MDPEEDNLQSLKGKACLDNCVTVLDAAELFNNLASISSLKASTPVQNVAATQQSNFKSPMQEMEKGVAAEDERNVAELLLDSAYVHFPDHSVVQRFSFPFIGCRDTG